MSVVSRPGQFASSPLRLHQQSKWFVSKLPPRRRNSTAFPRATVNLFVAIEGDCTASTSPA
jgi:hypothetical protein